MRGIYLRNDLLDIHIFADNGRVIATEFERQSLQRLGTALHDLFTCYDGSGETDLINIRVRCQHRPKVVPATQNLKHTRREEFTPKLHQFEVAIGRERRWLDDEGVTRTQRGGNFSTGQQDGIIPRNDGTAYTQRKISVDDLLLVIFFDNVFREIHLAEGFEPGGPHVHLPCRLR